MGQLLITPSTKGGPSYINVKHCLDFSFVFSAPLPAWRNLFSARGIFWVEGTTQAVLGSSDQRKVPASLSLFLKSEKVPALLSLGKWPEYRPFSYTQCICRKIRFMLLKMKEVGLTKGRYGYLLKNHKRVLVKLEGRQGQVVDVRFSKDNVKCLGVH